MNLVDGHGRVQRVDGRAVFKKSGVVPFVVEVPDYRGGARWFLVEESYGVGLFNLISELSGIDVELVERAFVDAGDKTFPDSGRASRLELMRLRVPVIEAADHRYVAGVGSPDSEDGALGSFGFDDVRAQLVVDAVMAAFVEQVEIFGGQQGDVVADWG